MMDSARLFLVRAYSGFALVFNNPMMPGTCRHGVSYLLYFRYFVTFGARINVKMIIRARSEALMGEDIFQPVGPAVKDHPVGKADADLSDGYRLRRGLMGTSMKLAGSSDSGGDGCLTASEPGLCSRAYLQNFW